MTPPSLEDAVGRLTELDDAYTLDEVYNTDSGADCMDLLCADLRILLSALVEMRWKNEALGRALRPFANAYRDNMLHVVVEYHYDLSGPTSRILTPSEFKAARQALRQKESAK